MSDTYLTKQCLHKQFNSNGWMNLYLKLVSQFSLGQELLSDINYHTLLRDYLFLEDFRQNREQVCKLKLSKWYHFLKRVKECHTIYCLLLSIPWDKALQNVAFKQSQQPIWIENINYKGLPTSHSICICNNLQVDDLTHYLLNCRLYQDSLYPF